MISRINWKLCLALFIFCLGGLALRILPILSDNVHFSFDQGLDILMVKQLVVDHKINLISRYSGLQGVLMGPLWTWLMAIPFTVSGGSPIANVIFLSILSILGSLTTFFLFKNILGTKTSLLLFILTLISPSFSGNTRVILSPNILIYIFSFYIFFLYQIFVLKKAIYWIPLLFIIGIFFQFEIAFAIFTVPPLFACLAIFHAWQTLKPKYLVLGFILGGITFLPQLIFDLRHHFIITNSLLGFIKGTNNSLYGEKAVFGGSADLKVFRYADTPTGGATLACEFALGNRYFAYTASGSLVIGGEVTKGFIEFTPYFLRIEHTLERNRLDPCPTGVGISKHAVIGLLQGTKT
jgi:hypothetical protein